MELTPDDQRREYIQAMGNDLGTLCYELRDDWDWLRHKWCEFQELFLGGPERIELQNTVASNFFYTLQKLMYEDAMLHLCRLTDRERTSGQINLTVLRLHEPIADNTLKSTVQAAAQKARLDCDFARSWRNKRLAHRAYATRVSVLPNVTSAAVEGAIKSLDVVLRNVEAHYQIPHSIWSGDPWGAKSLLHYLKMGHNFQVQEERRISRQIAESGENPGRLL